MFTWYWEQEPLQDRSAMKNSAQHASSVSWAARASVVALLSLADPAHRSCPTMGSLAYSIKKIMGSANINKHEGILSNHGFTSSPVLELSRAHRGAHTQQEGTLELKHAQPRRIHRNTSLGRTQENTSTHRGLSHRPPAFFSLPFTTHRLTTRRLQ
jgi:hypothetical protein